MARIRKIKENEVQPGLFDLTLYLRTAPCVPALRKLVTEWRDNGYQGITPTTRTLLNYPRVAQRDAKEKEKGFADTFEAGLAACRREANTASR
jgi:hypothetical protein